jgi:hypothetical protein
MAVGRVVVKKDVHGDVVAGSGARVVVMGDARRDLTAGDRARVVIGGTVSGRIASRSDLVIGFG